MKRILREVVKSPSLEILKLFESFHIILILDATKTKKKLNPKIATDFML